MRSSSNPQPNGNYWLTEPATDVDPSLIARRPSFGLMHIYYHGTTGQPLGMIRKVPPGGFPSKPYICGNFRTAWFSCGQIETKSHWGLDAAKKFLQRKFTRTVPARNCREGRASSPLRAAPVYSVQGSRFNSSKVQRSRPVQNFQPSTFERLAA